LIVHIQENGILKQEEEEEEEEEEEAKKIKAYLFVSCQLVFIYFSILTCRFILWLRMLPGFLHLL
jgi:hypothetical protein